MENLLKHKKEFYQKNKEKIRIKNYKYKVQRLKTDINFRISERLRNRLSLALKSNQKSGSAVRDLGCTIPELKIHLENQFQKGMTWDNWSFCGWHIDHKVPLSLFDLEDREQFLKANHYTNLQPLWAVDNLKKHNSIINKIKT